MLDLIILGLIPGTSIQLSFINVVVVGFSAATILYAMLLVKRRFQKQPPQDTADFTSFAI